MEDKTPEVIKEFVKQTNVQVIVTKIELPKQESPKKVDKSKKQ